jgi:hypothetical protein
MEKVRTFYQNLHKKKTLKTDYSEFLINNPKISDASKDAMEADLSFKRSIKHLSELSREQLLQP